MSVSSINATSGTMGAAAAIAQAQAVQYASHFAELHNAIDSGDLGGARKALSEFQRDSSVATANGFDPVNQTSSLRREFSSIRNALLKGDIKAAQTALSTLKKELGVEVPVATEPGESPVVLKAENLSATKVASGTFEKDAALASSKNSKSLGTGGDVIRDIRSLRVVGQSGLPQKTSSTFIKIQAALTSFTQAPQVFPTSGQADSTLSVLSVKTSTQAVLQGLAATQPNAQARDLGGTSFAPTPELMLGSKGMSIPAGAELQLANNPVLLQTFAFRR
jgi:hypothetical protein